MKDPRKTSKTSLAAPAILAAALVAAALAGTAAADQPQTLAEVMRTRPATGSRALPEPEPAREAGATETASAENAAAQLAETWGVEVASIRLTAHDHMIDYRYRVLDAAKADQLFRRQIKPQLIHQETGRVLAVPDTAKVGPLRNSNTPQEGKIYWMFFGNAENLVKPGDKVTVLIGDFVVEDLVVE